MTIKNFQEYEQEYKKSIENPEEFWAGKAHEFIWKKPWDKVLEWDFKTPSIKWFFNGKLNITENCLDRHLEKRGSQIAIIWEPNNPNEEVVKLTYRELHQKVCKMANVLKKHGIKKGDRVCIYMPMIPELAIAVLACARVGAIHSVVFAGFSADSLASRIDDAGALMLITSDCGFRGEKKIDFTPIIDEVASKCSSIKTVLVHKKISIDRVADLSTSHVERDIMSEAQERIFWLHEEIKDVSDHCEAETMDSEDPLFILYTSGSTGKPKGVVHTIGGYMVYADYSFRNVFQYEEGDVYWCTADIGWITGHSYVIYAPLLAGGTTLMFEGIPTFPDSGRFWQIIDKHQVNIFYTAPTAIRALMAEGLEYVKPYKLDSLKTLGTVGEPINEEAWHWYNENIGKKKCPIVDTWWQTETGGIVISPLAGITPLKPCFATLPLPGVKLVLVNDNGEEITEHNITGNLCIKFPVPGMIRTTYGDHVRCRETYFSQFPGLYFTGDGAFRDEDGYYRIIGRVDDVINVSGHRLGTAEIENAINQTRGVIESAVIGYSHPIKGEGIFAFVIAASGKNLDADFNAVLSPESSLEPDSYEDFAKQNRSGSITSEASETNSAALSLSHVKSPQANAWNTEAQPKGEKQAFHGDITNEVSVTKQIINQVVKTIGPIAKPDQILFVENLPKTRSGKIMRRILKKIVANDENLGDTSTLIDPKVVDAILQRFRKLK